MVNRSEAVKQYNKSKSDWKKYLKAPRSRTRCFLSSPISPAHAVSSRRSRISIRSTKILPRSAAILEATIPVTSQTLIYHYPDIATDIHIDGLLDVRI